MNNDGKKKHLVGDERVVVGTHREKVGTRTFRVKCDGVLGLLGMTKDVEEDIYETVEEVEYRPVYEYVPEMKEIIEEIPVIEEQEKNKN